MSARDDPGLARTVHARLDALAKPRGSLGRLEELALRLALAQGSERPATRPRRLVIFAGDHGVVADGVSAWPGEVTAAIAATILAGRAASSALAASAGCALRLVDVGLALPVVAPAPGLRAARIAAGTASLANGPALDTAGFEAAWRIGEEEAHAAVADGEWLLLGGEIGIGNTTAAACLTALLAEVDARTATGRGAGADDATLARKRAVVEAAVARARATRDIGTAIASVAGLEIAALAGFYAHGAARGAALLLDGQVATAAALVAERLRPGTRRAMLAGHLSAEPGHAAALARLGLEPVLDWGMRLGEGTGALLALPLLDAAAALLRDVATLAEIGAVPGQDAGDGR